MDSEFDFFASGQKRAREVAVSNEKRVFTFDELQDATKKLQEAFFRPNFGNKPYIMALVALPSGPEATAIHIACLGGRGVAMPVPYRAKPLEFRHYMEVIKPSLFVIETVRGNELTLEELHDDVVVLTLDTRVQFDEWRKSRGSAFANLTFCIWKEIDQFKSGGFPIVAHDSMNLPKRLCMIQFTSGTSRLPKGILITQDNVRSYLDTDRAYLSMAYAKQFFCPLPQFHAFGATVALEVLFYGGTIHFSNIGMVGEHLKIFKDRSVTGIKASPSYFKSVLAVLDSPQHGIKTVCLGTAPVDELLVGNLGRLFPDAEIYVRYGLTETVGPISRLNAKKQVFQSGNVGAPLVGMQLGEKVMKASQERPVEVTIRGGAVAAGQLLERGIWRPLADSLGFFTTGDMGFVDSPGNLHLNGRISSFIKHQGFRISPFEIEDVLCGDQSVHEAVVIGVEDAKHGQRIVAVLEPRIGQPIDLIGIRRMCTRKLSSYKIPSSFLVAEPLIRTHVGKPDRNKIAEWASAKLEAANG